jgi:hypothetical protein
LFSLGLQRRRKERASHCHTPAEEVAIATELNRTLCAVLQGRQGQLRLQLFVVKHAAVALHFIF